MIMVSVGVLATPVTLILEAMADNATKKLSSWFRVIPVPTKAVSSVNTDLSVQTLPAFSVVSKSGRKNCFQLSMVEGSATLRSGWVT